METINVKRNSLDGKVTEEFVPRHVPSEATMTVSIGSARSNKSA